MKMCKENVFIFISNTNITCLDLLNVGLQLSEYIKRVLAHNFVYNFYKF